MIKTSKLNIKTILLLLCCSWATLNMAQSPPSFVNSGGFNSASNNAAGGGSGGNLPAVITVEDSTQYLYVDAPNRLYHITDTGVDYFHHFNPIKLKYPYPYQQLGDFGQAHQPMVYTPRIRKGFDLGYHAYDAYFVKPEDLKYYINKHPYTYLFYSQAQTQDDFNVIATFAKKLVERTYFGVNYNAITQEGIYQNQLAGHKNLALSLWHTSKDQRYRAYASYLSNTIQNKNNGGIVNENAISTGLFSSRAAVAVKLGDAQTRHTLRDVAFTQYYYLTPQLPDSTLVLDTTSSDKANLTLSHQIRYTNEAFKFFDTAPDTDSSFYQHFQVNNNGLRNYVDYHKIENTAKVGLEYKGQLTVGLRHALFLVNHEPADTIINNLFLTGNWLLDLDSDRFGLNIKAHYGILDNANDYTLDASMFVNFGKFGRLDGRLINQRYQPNLLQSKLYISREEFWNNSFNKTSETNLFAAYAIPRLNFSVEGRYHLIDNLIYFDTLAYPQQFDKIANIVQLMVHQNFKLWKLHLDNTVVWQNVTDNVLRFPTIATKHSLYFKGLVFKERMLAKIGFDVRYNSSYFADLYQPLTGQFHQQNSQQVNTPFIVDGFISFKVQRLRGFIKIENANQLATGEIYYAAPLYPVRDWFYRFGVGWKFVD